MVKSGGAPANSLICLPTSGKTSRTSSKRQKPPVESGNDTASHFTASSKVTSGGKHGTQTVSDIRLTRYACYLIAQNGDPTQKKIVAQAQTYFAVKTRGMELMEDELADLITQLGDDPLAEAM